MKDIEIFEYDGEGYNRTHTYGAWCVAFLNHGDRFTAPTYMERHNETDEVFVLLAGEATLLIGESGQKVKMSVGKIYNVHKGTWHQIVTKPGARCLVVEKSDTSEANSERREF